METEPVSVVIYCYVLITEFKIKQTHVKEYFTSSVSFEQSVSRTSSVFTDPGAIYFPLFSLIISPRYTQFITTKQDLCTSKRT